MSDSSQSEITRVLVRLQEGEIDRHEAADRVFEAAYAELRLLAANLMRGERLAHTLRPTALVHEAYIRLVDASKIDWQGRAHFLSIATGAMRRILIDHARRRLRAKREGGWKRVRLDPGLALSAERDVDLLRFEELLTELAGRDSRMARIVEMRVFGGMRNEEVARVLGVSARTVDGEWRMAKMWFTRALAEGGW